MINNADHLNETIDSTLPRPWLRTSLLYEYFSESERSHLTPFAAINGENVTEVDFHVNASFDYIKETGFWDDGEKIDEEWWFKNSETDTETFFSVKYPVNDQVKIGRVESEISLIISQPYIEDKLAWFIHPYVDLYDNLTYLMQLSRYDGGDNERFWTESKSF